MVVIHPFKGDLQFLKLVIDGLFRSSPDVRRPAVIAHGIDMHRAVLLSLDLSSV
jgi:hypothetical protein